MFQPAYSRPTLACILLFFSTCLYAAPAPTLSQLLDSATTTHPLMLGRRSAEEAARADKSGAEWARFPTPSFEATSRAAYGSAGVMRLEQPIFAGGRITSAIDAAGSRLDAAGAAVEEARLDLRLRVIAATVEVLRQKARLTHADVGVQGHRTLLEMIRRRVRQEVSSAIDQSLAEARLYQAENERSLIEQGLRNALTQLSQLTGRTVADVNPSGLQEAGAPHTLETAQKLAQDLSPTLQRLNFEEAAANADVGVRRAALLPQVALRLERSMGNVGESRAMVVLQAQPGAGLSAQSGIEAAAARRDSARHARESSMRELNERLAVDWNEWQSARNRLTNATQARQMSLQVFRSYARQYVIGRKSWLDVLNAVREAMQSDLAVEDARAQVLGASLRLRVFTGTLALP